MLLSAVKIIPFHWDISCPFGTAFIKKGGDYKWREIIKMVGFSQDAFSMYSAFLFSKSQRYYSYFEKKKKKSDEGNQNIYILFPSILLSGKNLRR